MHHHGTRQQSVERMARAQPPRVPWAAVSVPIAQLNTSPRTGFLLSRGEGGEGVLDPKLGVPTMA